MLPRELASNAGCACGCSRVARPSGRLARRSIWEVAVGVFSLGVWVFMPKCPVCLAAYLAVWTGLGLSFGAATYVRWALLSLSAAALLCLVARRLAKKTTRQLTQAARPVAQVVRRWLRFVVTQTSTTRPVSESAT